MFVVIVEGETGLGLDLVLELLGLLLDLLDDFGSLALDAAGHADAGELDDADESEEEVDGGEAMFQSACAFVETVYRRVCVGRGSWTYR